MSTYELDNDLVQRLVDNRDLLPATLHPFLRSIEDQLPVPAPTKLAAVVRVDNETSPVWVRFDTNTDPGHACWIDPQDGEHRSVDNIGRITEVLFEGVDL